METGVDALDLHGPSQILIMLALVDIQATHSSTSGIEKFQGLCIHVSMFQKNTSNYIIPNLTEFPAFDLRNGPGRQPVQVNPLASADSLAFMTSGSRGVVGRRRRPRRAASAQQPMDRLRM